MQAAETLFSSVRRGVRSAGQMVSGNGRTVSRTVAGHLAENVKEINKLQVSGALSGAVRTPQMAAVCPVGVSLGHPTPDTRTGFTQRSKRMTARTHIKRRTHGDRLLAADSPAELTATDYAVAPFDRACLDADQTWGVNRLPELVSPETAAKWGSALAKLNAAILAADTAETIARVNVCLRGIAAMDAEARERGHQPLAAHYWQTVIDGRRVAMVRESGDWPAVARELPGVTIYTLDEAAAALMRRADDWPAATTPPPAPRTAVEIDINDVIPF